MVGSESRDEKYESVKVLGHQTISFTLIATASNDGDGKYPIQVLFAIHRLSHRFTGSFTPSQEPGLRKNYAVAERQLGNRRESEFHFERGLNFFMLRFISASH